MAIFSGKIEETKFLDKQKTMIEILYKEGDNLIAHAVEVDFENSDFQALIKEVDLEDIEKNTIVRNQELVKQKRAAVDTAVENRLQNGFIEKLQTINVLVNEVIANRNDESFLFKMKSELFKLPEVSNSKAWWSKRKMQKSKDALEILALLNKVVK